MKKILLIFSLSLLSTLGYSQSEKNVKIDSLVSVTLPAVYSVKDTLGQQTFTAKSSYGFIVITRVPNAKNNTPLKKEKDLKKVFQNYVKGVQQIGNGNIVNESDTTVGTLKGHLFTLRTEDDGGNYQDRRFLFLYTKDVSYTFQYYYDELRADLTTTEAKNYFGSITLAPDLQRNDQYLAVNNTSSALPVSQIAIYGGGVLILLAIVLTIIRRRRLSDAV